MVRHHFANTQDSPDGIKVIHSAIDPGRFPQHDRLRLRQEGREQWGLSRRTSSGCSAKNYHLKGLSALLHAVAVLCSARSIATPRRHPAAPCAQRSDAAFEREAARPRGGGAYPFVGQFPDIRTAFYSRISWDPTSTIPVRWWCWSDGLRSAVITSRYNGRELMHHCRGFVVDVRTTCTLPGVWPVLDPARRRALRAGGAPDRRPWTFEHHYRQLVQAFQSRGRKQSCLIRKAQNSGRAALAALAAEKRSSW